MVRWFIRLTHLTLVYEVIRYRMVQVRQNLKKKDFRVGGLQSPFSISSSFLLFFVLLPFFLNTKNDFFVEFNGESEAKMRTGTRSNRRPKMA